MSGRGLFDPDADVLNFEYAPVLYERDDYGTMMQCATLFATALAHSPYRPGILKGDNSHARRLRCLA